MVEGCTLLRQAVHTPRTGFALNPSVCEESLVTELEPCASLVRIDFGPRRVDPGPVSYPFTGWEGWALEPLRSRGHFAHPDVAEATPP